MESPQGYETLPDPPSTASATAALVRLVDGLAFRFRWATEDLTAQVYAQRPRDDFWTLRELVEHVYTLARWVERSLDESARRPRASDIGLNELRDATLATLWRARTRLAEMDDAAWLALTITGSRERGPESVWCMINGPLADALTHVGQINTWRKLAGSPAPRADVFRGLPPTP